jgi:transposase-like protein
MYLEGLGFRSIEPILGVSNVTILNCWIRWIPGFSKNFQDEKEA